MRHATLVACFTLLLCAESLQHSVRFRERPAGVDAALRNYATPQKHLIETMAGGVAVLDYDQDGHLDLFLTNGAEQPSLRKTGPTYSNRLYRNRGDGSFEDVTAVAGLAGEGYSCGVAIGDYDNDGYPDLFVAGVNRDLLYHNKRDGTFEEVTRTAGLEGLDANGHKPWSVAAGWFDYDNDGRLDLFVVRYVRWDPAKEPFCGDVARGIRTYCHPKEYEPQPNALYHNEGSGKFRNVSVESGIAQYPGKGMSLAFGDYDEDGDIDVLVTNDTMPNSLFRNDGGHFVEAGTAAGVSLNDEGRALSSMGVDWRDIDNDGRPDIFITALANETHPLFQNLGGGLFADITYRSLVGKTTLPWSGWGAGAIDLDNDGWKDLFIANGDVHDNTEKFSGRASKQGVEVLRNQGGRTFIPEAAVATPPALHRGVAFGDLNNDGRVDAVVSRLGERPLILWNESAPKHHWIRVRLRGKRSNRDGLGAMVKVTTASGKKQWNTVTSAVGYASSSEAVAHFGLGDESAAVRIEIRWPGGKLQVKDSVPVDQVLLVAEP